MLIPYARHGRGLALYGLKRYPEARDTWVGLLNQSAPRAVAWEGTFWLGDTLGRLGDYPGAVQRLQTFVSGGPQVLIDSGLLRLGWWSRAAGQPLDAAKAYRGHALGVPAVARGLVGAGRARAGAARPRRLRGRARRGQEARAGGPERPARGAGAAPDEPLGHRAGASRRGPRDQRRPAGAHPRPRRPAPTCSRSARRRAGSTASSTRRATASSWCAPRPGRRPWPPYAALRLAQMDFDTREFARARDGARKLAADTAAPPEVRAAAQVLGGEAAYWARDYAQAAALYGGFLTSHALQPEAPMVSLALGWAELRGGKPDAARQRWARFAQQAQSRSARAGGARAGRGAGRARGGLGRRPEPARPGGGPLSEQRVRRGRDAQPRDPRGARRPRRRHPAGPGPPREPRRGLAVRGPRPGHARGGAARHRQAGGGGARLPGRPRPRRDRRRAARARQRELRARAVGSGGAPVRGCARRGQRARPRTRPATASPPCSSISGRSRSSSRSRRRWWRVRWIRPRPRAWCTPSPRSRWRRSAGATRAP